MDRKLLEDKIEQSGLKYTFIAQKLDITEFGLIKKRQGAIPFKIPEINILTDLLHLTVEERDAIFGLTSPK